MRQILWTINQYLTYPHITISESISNTELYYTAAVFSISFHFIYVQKMWKQKEVEK